MTQRIHGGGSGSSLYFRSASADELEGYTRLEMKVCEVCTRNYLREAVDKQQGAPFGRCPLCIAVPRGTPKLRRNAVPGGRDGQSCSSPIQ